MYKCIQSAPLQQESEFRLYHDLMQSKVRNILLVSSPYDAWVMEEDCKLSERLVSEYRGLNLSRPPRLRWSSSAEEALSILGREKFELVIIMPSRAEAEDYNLAREIKDIDPHLPVILLPHHGPSVSEKEFPEWIDWYAIWTGNAELLLALVKLAEDAVNAEHDVLEKGVRVIVLVEDSPHYLAALLPTLYKELVVQTQAVIQDGLNQEHRLLSMRARPKVLVAKSYEEALTLFERFEEYILGVLSDVRFYRKGILDARAGIALLDTIKKQHHDFPLLMLSSEPENRLAAKALQTEFLNKNSPSFLEDMRHFIVNRLGFGDFTLRNKHGEEVARASTLHQLEKALKTVSDDVFLTHAKDNDFSRWLFARTEIELAKSIRPLHKDEFETHASFREHVLQLIRKRRLSKQDGIIVSFNAKNFDPDIVFFKMGEGSIGGKARGLAFLNSIFRVHAWIKEKYPEVSISLPKSLAISADEFDRFIMENNLGFLGSADDVSDEEIAGLFQKGTLAKDLKEQLKAYLTEITYPLSVRSSSLLEDAQFQPYAGLYSTVFLPNNHPDSDERLHQLTEAIKKVYASTYYKAPKAFSRRVKMRTDEEKMGVIIQQVIGQPYGNAFYPTLSGVAQSRNFYPFGRMKTEEGIATIALGFGKTVVEGELCLRFSPARPHIQSQGLTTQDCLKNAQKDFYYLDLSQEVRSEGTSRLLKAEMALAHKDALTFAASSYDQQEGRIRDFFDHPKAPRVITFAPVLLHKVFPLASLVKDFLSLLEQSTGAPVEMEFAVNLYHNKEKKNSFTLLQVRPMNALGEQKQISITDKDRQNAFCVSANALGNCKREVVNIIYVRPKDFEIEKTIEISREISEINRKLCAGDEKYILIGPGRWGSSDRWLGIPVKWDDISGVGAIVETSLKNLKADPSQGSHFFHNITTLGISYAMVDTDRGDILNWQWLEQHPVVFQGEHVSWIKTELPVTIKVDGRRGQCVMLPGKGEAEASMEA